MRLEIDDWVVMDRGDHTSIHHIHIDDDDIYYAGSIVDDFMVRGPWAPVEQDERAECWECRKDVPKNVLTLAKMMQL